MNTNRAGSFIKQPSGYVSFVPAPLPPDPSIEFDSEMISLLSKADRMLGRLDGVTQTLPDPKLFVAMYVQKEAVLSSQIEGTQASLTDVLELQGKRENNEDIGEVVNYVNAMNYGLNRLEDFPLSLRLIREIHAKLLESGRGSERNPGEFRKTQNWIGPAGSTLKTATFIPPTVPDMIESLNQLELYLYKDDDIPALVKIALIHAQFETIHPFLDGNGRMGRLLITFWLCQRKILSQPLLYLSYYFKQNRTEYYDRLMAIRKKGDWEGWVKYFLRGIAFISEESIETAKRILLLKEECERKLSQYHNANHLQLLNHLFMSPICTKSLAAEYLGTSLPTAGKIIDIFCNNDILHDITPDHTRYKRYAFIRYIDILSNGTEV